MTTNHSAMKLDAQVGPSPHTASPETGYEITLPAARSGRAHASLFDGVTVFSATKSRDRERLGERITDWPQSNRMCQVVKIVVTQSSDAEFHCLAVTVFWKHAVTDSG
jgi:hypothetical protein